MHTLPNIRNTCPDRNAYGTHRPRHIGSIRRGGSMEASWPEIPGSAPPISLPSITKILGGKSVIMQFCHFCQIFPWLESRWESPYLKFVICKSSFGKKDRRHFSSFLTYLSSFHTVTKIFLTYLSSFHTITKIFITYLSSFHKDFHGSGIFISHRTLPTFAPAKEGNFPLAIDTIE